jgi:hypothetical protein
MAAKTQPSAATISFSPPENIWSALRATKEKAALSRHNFQKNPNLAQFYAQARTYFQQNT